MDTIASKTPLDLLATILEDDHVRDYDAEARSLLELREGPAREAVARLAREVT